MEFNVFFQPEMPNRLWLKWLKIINLKKILLGKRHTMMINGYTGALTPRWAKPNKQTKKRNKKNCIWIETKFFFFFLLFPPCDCHLLFVMIVTRTRCASNQQHGQPHRQIHKAILASTRPQNRTAAAVSVLCAKQALLTQSRTINLEIKTKEQPYLRINISHLC